MPDLPIPVLEYISAEMLEERYAAYLQVDAHGRITAWGGHLDRCGVRDLQQGDAAGSHVAFLQNLLPAPERTFMLPCLRTESGVSADVHVFSTRDSDYVLLLDATEEMARRSEIQQKANELSLLKEKQRRAELRQDSSAAAPVPFANILEALLAGLELVAFQAVEPRVFRALSRFPDWFLLLYPEANLDKDELRFDSRFPFLENFLIDAEEFWNQKNPGRIRSGPWIEADYYGKEWDLEASAIYWNEHPILVIQSLRAEYAEKQALIQKGREKALRARTTARKQKALEVLGDRYEAMLVALNDWVLIVNAEGVCLDSRTDVPELSAARIKGKTVGEFLPPHVAEQFLKSIKKAIQTNERQSLGYQLESERQPRYFHARFGPASRNEVVCVIRNVSSH